jgi:glycosyltransferase involved in cell wall biosynthesis
VPQVSAIIPGYNYARYLGEAIDSVLAQTHPAHEIIVIDDGSTDDTPAVAQRYAGKIRYVRTENGGVSRARNTGIALATGDLVAFLDADDRWLPRKLERQVAALAAHPEAGLVHTGSRVFDQEGGTTLCEFEPEAALDVHALIRCCSISASSVLIPRAVFEKVGAFDVALVGTEDWDMWLRIAAAHRVVGCPGILVEYRSHGRSLSGNAERQFRNSMAALDKASRLHPGCAECRAALRAARTQMRREYFRKLTSLARAAFREHRAAEGWRLRLSAICHHPRFVCDLPQLFRERAAARAARSTVPQAAGL